MSSMRATPPTPYAGDAVDRDAADETSAQCQADAWRDDEGGCRRPPGRRLPEAIGQELIYPPRSGSPNQRSAPIPTVEGDEIASTISFVVTMAVAQLGMLMSRAARMCSSE